MATPEVCEAFGVNRATVIRWVAEGKLQPAFKVPGQTGAFIFNRKYIEALAAERAQEEADRAATRAAQLAEDAAAAAKRAATAAEVAQRVADARTAAAS